MNLWLITVNYGQTKTTKNLIESLMKCEQLESIKIGIADNETSEKSKVELQKISNMSNLDIELFYYDENHFYWPAAKKVIKRFKEQLNHYPDWIMICNNDITFIDKNFMSRLEKLNQKKYPIVGPNIINESGRPLNPFMINPLSKIDNLYWWLYFLSYPTSKLVGTIKRLLQKMRSNKDGFNQNNSSNVYAVHGSAILFSSYFFEKGGWLDDQFEMYGEELTVAEIAIQLKLPVIYNPDIKIMHHEHTNTKKTDKKLLFQKGRDAHRYVRSIYIT
ncbi:MAG: hypothetical protein HOD28_04440 [Candidatus Marinimicrobia bacterium]|nr:hypothetical protein [Candidatus Neomarinimicrobiota bacterium]MBT6391714.1 hypothetical protein [Candidatus Neomarinimicrobiota bacterium]